MKKMIITIIVLCCLFSFLLGATTKRQQWEYASYIMLSAEESGFLWNSPEEGSILGCDVAEILTKMGVPYNHEDTLSNNTVFNCVGKKGWELFTILNQERGVVYYFKRPK
ncbi:MAG: hypothetical protein ACYSTX_02355 [Planctomycetota bacterium]|jgi:hypothetical protein